MPRPANPQTPEGRALTAAIAASGHTQAQLAEKLDVSPGFISQFASGHRPVPWDKAELLAPLLGLDAGKISAEYRRISEHFGASQHSRLTKETILDAVRLATASVTGAGMTSFEIETPEDAELLLLAIEEVLSEDIHGTSYSDVQRFARKLHGSAERKGGKVGSGGTDGRVGRATGAAEVGEKSRTSARQRRKSA